MLSCGCSINIHFIISEEQWLTAISWQCLDSVTLNWASGGPVIITILSLDSEVSAGAIWEMRGEESKCGSCMFSCHVVLFPCELATELKTRVVRYQPWWRPQRSGSAVWCAGPSFRWWPPLPVLGCTRGPSPALETEETRRKNFITQPERLLETQLLRKAAGGFPHLRFRCGNGEHMKTDQVTTVTVSGWHHHYISVGRPLVERINIASIPTPKQL